MTKSELTEIVNACYEAQLSAIANPDVMKELLLKYSEGNDNPTPSQLSSFALIESLEFSRQLLESVLSEVLQCED